MKYVLLPSLSEMCNTAENYLANLIESTGTIIQYITWYTFHCDQDGFYR